MNGWHHLRKMTAYPDVLHDPERIDWSHYFWAKACPEGLSGCWLWDAGVNRYGYGTMTVARRVWGAHRLAFTLVHGPIPEGLFVCHRCDVRACVNPRHLFLGTPSDNVRDMQSKGRGRANPQPELAASKLTLEQVRQVRVDLSNGIAPRDIAAPLGVSATAIRSIQLGRTWRSERVSS